MRKTGLAIISFACMLMILSVSPDTGRYNLDLFIFSILLAIAGIVMAVKGGRKKSKKAGGISLIGKSEGGSDRLQTPKR